MKSQPTVEKFEHALRLHVGSIASSDGVCYHSSDLYVKQQNA